MADAQLEALRSSVTRLRELVADIGEAELNASAYPTEWSIADVLSHIGSGAVILQRRMEDALAGASMPDDFAPRVWATWNAKSPTEKRDGALAADAEMLSRLDAVTDEERSTFSFAMGPMIFGFSEFVGLRLNEHALHTWDIDVVGNPAAAMPADAAALVVDNLGLIARFTGKPTGDERTITVVTNKPERSFTITLAADSVSFEPSNESPSPDVELPAEAFIRLVYGRLDREHTPPGSESTALDVLRQVFPGP